MVSWNTSIKRKKILNYLKQNGSDIAMLQETHLNKEESEIFKKEWDVAGGRSGSSSL